MLAFSAANARRDDLRLGLCRQSKHAIDHLIDGLSLNHLAAVGTVRNAAARIEQAQIVVNLRHGADRTARVVARTLLIDGDRGGKPIYAVDIRLFHLP